VAESSAASTYAAGRAGSPLGTGRIVVVGASLAGLRAVEALRAGGHEGPITVIGAEVHRPYDRPPLSKHLLTGRVDVAEIGLPVDSTLDVDWHLGEAATGVDLTRSVVRLGNGSGAAFDGLVIATGAHARTLPFAPLPSAPLAGVHQLRTLDDAVALRTDLERGPRVVVIGAGFIGLEVAASSRALRLDVAVVEVAPVALVAAVGTLVGGVIGAIHRDHGVDLRLATRVDGLVGAAGRVEGVRLGTGEVLAADVVVIGVGASPTTGWLEGSGIDLADGVRTDDRLRVLAGGRPLPHVVAAGDVARSDQPDGTTLRIEHWTNAVEQGAAAAATLLHGDAAAPFAPVPYFWSDHYDRKIQMVGRAAPADDVSIVDGSLDERRFVAAYGRDGRLVAALGVNRPAKVTGLGRRIAQGDSYPPAM
jgi:NADPH-dependent 2,4-dienoyl-CoA reductase/sulfur reductase-like enzyme